MGSREGGESLGRARIDIGPLEAPGPIADAGSRDVHAMGGIESQDILKWVNRKIRYRSADRTHRGTAHSGCVERSPAVIQSEIGRGEGSFVGAR